MIHDDLDKRVGVVAPKVGGSAGGNKGLKSIISQLGTSNFRRLRVGVDRPGSREPAVVAGYLLSGLTSAELAQIDDGWERAMPTLCTPQGR